MSDPLRILGIDPGSRLTGFGVVDFSNDRAAYVASGVVRSMAGDFPSRLQVIFNSVMEIVEQHRPDVVVIERVFVHRNPDSALKLGQARAAAMCASFNRDISVHEYSPREIKQAVVGNGGASKAQVQHMVVSLLKLEGEPTSDAADALAAALCHGNRRRLDEQLGQGSFKEARR